MVARAYEKMPELPWDKASRGSGHSKTDTHSEGWGVSGVVGASGGCGEGCAGALQAGS